MADGTTRRFKPIYAVGLALIALAIALSMNAFGSALTPYVNVAEAKETERAVQVMGYPTGAEEYNEGIFRFTMEDDFGQPIEVEYRQPRPGNFDQAISVVAIGAFDAERNIFVADDLLVKCPSKYQEEGVAVQ